ncbi:hypothetical protein, partial [Bacillus paranthracis]|uniref:hypothetical protein n=1 Tax=Bacillus paranthracis TaxID=2026186 RepID=UPI003D236DCC
QLQLDGFVYYQFGMLLSLHRLLLLTPCHSLRSFHAIFKSNTIISVNRIIYSLVFNYFAKHRTK